MQGIFNLQALKMLPKVLQAIQNAASFESNQIQYYALQRINNGYICLDDMSNKQIQSFQDDILLVCKMNGWI